MATCWWISYHFPFVMSKLKPQMPQMMIEILYKILISEASQVGEMGGSEYLQGPINELELKWVNCQQPSQMQLWGSQQSSGPLQLSKTLFKLLRALQLWTCRKTHLRMPAVSHFYHHSRWMCLLRISWVFLANQQAYVLNGGWIHQQSACDVLVFTGFSWVDNRKLPRSFSKEIPLDFKSTQSPVAAKLHILCESSGGFSGGEFDSEPTCLDRTLTKSQPSGLARWSFVRLGRGVSVNVVKGRYPWSSSYSCISMYEKTYTHICM